MPVLRIRTFSRVCKNSQDSSPERRKIYITQIIAAVKNMNDLEICCSLEDIRELIQEEADGKSHKSNVDTK